MFSEASRGLSSIEIGGLRPMVMTAGAESLQPEPLAASEVFFGVFGMHSPARRFAISFFLSIS